MKRTLACLISAVLALTLCGCKAKQPEPPPVSAENGAASVEPTPAQPEKWDFSIVTETAREEYRIDDGTVLATWSVEQPVLLLKNEAGETFFGEAAEYGATEEQLAACKAFNDAVSDYMDASRKEFENMKEEAKEQYEWKRQEDLEFIPLVDETTLAHTFRRGDLLSVTATRYNCCGGAHPDWGYVCWNFDLAAGKAVTPVSLTDDPAGLRAMISDCVVEGVYTSEWHDGYYDDFEDIVRAREDFDASFDETGMTVWFQEYEIAPHALGVPEFTVPYGKLSRFLTAYAAELLDISAEEKALGDYYDAEELWYWLEGGAPVDYEDSRTIRLGEGDDACDFYYARVKIPGVTTMNDLRKRLCARFSDELVDKKLAPDEFGHTMFREFDGLLYAAPGDRGADMYVHSVSFRAELNAAQTGGRIVATVQWQDYDETKEEWVLTEQSEVEFPFELGPTGARFSEFYSIY